jgi:hypothetical protein
LPLFEVIFIPPSELWAHRFGHDPALKGLVPPGQSQPAHLILTLDVRDPRLAPLALDVGPFLRLVHPFYFSQGDPFAYRHIHPDEIAFVSTNTGRDPFRCLAPDWPSEGFPRELPAHDIDIQTWDPELDSDPIYIGDDVPTWQSYDETACVACAAGGVRLIASVPNDPLPELDIWNSMGVSVVFWYCLSCKAIVTHNECDWCDRGYDLAEASGFSHSITRNHGTRR